MAVTVRRRVDFPMIDMANITYYPRIYDLAHRCFEEAWAHICDVEYATLLMERNLGFPVVDVSPPFTAPSIRPYGRHDDVDRVRRHHQRGLAVPTRGRPWTTVWSSRQVTVGVDMQTMEPVRS